MFLGLAGGGVTLKARVVCFAALLLGAWCYGLAQGPDPIVLPSAVVAALGHPLPQTKVGDCDGDATMIEWRRGVVIHQSPHSGIAEVTGRDRRGRAWNVTVPGGSNMECEIWAATLRKGYAEDLIFFSGEWVGRNVAELTILFLDRDGRPYPWTATGNWTETDAGVDQLAMDEATGNAVLVYPVREGDKFSPGYVYSLFRITGDSIAKVVNRTWPAVSGDPKALAGTERKGTESELFKTPDASAEQGWLRVRAGGATGTSGELAYSDGSKSRYPAMVVLDRADGSRRVYLDGETPGAMKAAQTGGYRVQRQGTTCEEEECRPFVLFGVKP